MIKRREEFVKRQMVSLNATDTLRAVVLVCLSFTVILLMKNLRAKLTALIDSEANTEKN